MNGDTILNALKVQVVHYTIESSLFDIILAAFFRFALLIVFYGVFATNDWIIIAVSLYIPIKRKKSFNSYNIHFICQVYYNCFLCVFNWQSLLLQCKCLPISLSTIATNI